MVRGAVVLSYLDPTPFLREILTDNQSSRYFPWSHENVFFEGFKMLSQIRKLLFLNFKTRPGKIKPEA